MTIEDHRIEKLLALLLIQTMKGSSVAEKALHLNIAGFTNVEIADLLNTSANVIGQRLFEIRKKKIKGK